MASLSVLHLSDLHITTGLKPPPDPAVLLDAARRHLRFPTVILAVTGDIAYSGSSSEYEVAKIFVEALVRRLESEGKAVTVACLPGNHDVNILENPLHELTLKGITSLPDDNVLEAMAATQGAFFNFVESLDCNVLQWRSRLRTQDIVHVDGQQVQLVLLNTAICSSVKNNVPHRIYCPPVSPIARNTDAALTIAMQHHPLTWLDPENRTNHTDQLVATADLLLAGHEHIHEMLQLSKLEAPPITVVNALPLVDSNAPKQGFSVHQIDIDRRIIEEAQLVSQGNGYHSSSSEIHKLHSETERGSNIRLTNQATTWLSSLSVEIRHRSGAFLSHDSIYVHPPLQIHASNRATKSSDAPTRVDGARLAELVQENGKTLLIGEQGSGKTQLLKQLFRDLRNRGVAAVIISASELNASNCESKIKAEFDRTYQARSGRTFFDLPYAERAILVDDLDRLKKRKGELDSVLGELTRMSGVVAGTCTDDVLVLDPLTGGSGKLGNCLQVQLLPFGHVKRGELIAKWVAHESEVDDAVREARETYLGARLQELLSQKVIPSQPFILTALLESIDNSEAVNEAAGALGFHYERLILQALHRAQNLVKTGNKVPVPDDVALEFLGRICYRLFFDDCEVVSEAALRDITAAIRKELIVSVALDDVLNVLLKARLLKKVSDDGYVYTHQYVLLFSVAKLLANWIGNADREEEVRAILDGLVTRMHEEQPAAVLVYFVFLTRDSAVVNSLIDRARALFSDVRPSNFGPELDRFLGLEAGVWTVPELPGQNTSDNRRKRNETLDQIDGAQNSEVEESRDLLDGARQLKMALQCMYVLGQVLRCYPTKLTGAQKLEIAAEIYLLGLRTLSEFADMLESAREILREYFKKITDGHVDKMHIDEFTQAFEAHVGWYVRIAALGVVRRIARAVGSVHLRDLYGLVDIEGCDVSLKIINRAIGLEALLELRASETTELYRSLDKEGHRVACEVLQLLVYDYLYLVPVDGGTLQSVLAGVKLKESKALLMRSNKLRPGLPGRKRKKKR